MTQEEIIESIKEQYNRDLRKQLVKSLLEHEKNRDQAALRSGYQIINQIFSYVLSELGWTITDNASKWDTTPLDIMRASFPKLETTQWFAQQQLNVQKSIEVKMAEEAKEGAE